MDKKKRMPDAQQRFLLNGSALILILFAIGCIKHLIRLRLWYTLIFAGIEDVVLIITMYRLWRYRSMDRDQKVRDLALIALFSIVLIGVISQVGMGVLNK